MIRHGLENKDKIVLSSDYDEERAKKMFTETYNRINLPAKYEKPKTEQATTSKFGFGKTAAPAVNTDVHKLFDNPQTKDLVCKSEWLWNQYLDKGNDKQTEEEVTYSVACLVKVVELLIVRKDKQAAPEVTPNKRVILLRLVKSLSYQMNQMINR